ncbi:ABC transporter substrate-binding protein [Halosimplex amylolyticum]|uniref:ABC transporter substrate-binding protein n=1 Tax=Halosimplex amylolyticum TaxID=3396616 RepID=UPI003F57D459
MTIELTIACGDRDLNRALLTGDVEPDGVDATPIPVYPSNRHRRFFADREFDVCEVSLASYLSSRAHPEQYPFTAIPVFPAKRFRHSFFYRHADADVDGPAALEGKNVGVSSWQTTANVWMRGIAGDFYGLDLESVTWFRRKGDDVPIDVPDRFDVRPVPGKHGGDAVAEREDLKRALFEGELAAAMDPAGSLFWDVAESERAEFVFEDPLAAEREYFAETGIHPPMHAVAIMDDVLDDHPWVATEIFDAFCESRDACLERNASPSANASLTWAHLHLLEQRRILGEDAWAYGLTDRNRRGLAKFVEYAHDQGLIPREYDVEALFVDGFA